MKDELGGRIMKNFCCVEAKDIQFLTDLGCIDKKDKEQKEILTHKTKF